MGYIANGEELTSIETDLVASLSSLAVSSATQAIQKTSSTTFANIEIETASGTVTSVSVTTANGISGTVATATTTPAITLTLGAITPTSVAINGGTALTTSNQTGTGSLVLATSPTLVTPILGTPTSGTLTNCTGLPVAGITASTSTAIGVGSVELGHATDTTIARVSAGVISVEGVTVPTISSTNTLSNKRRTPRVYTATNNASLTPEIDTYDVFHLTAMSAATTINNHSTSTPVDGEVMLLRFLDNGTARALTWGTAYVAKAGTALPTTTTVSKNLACIFEYNSNLAKWNLLSVGLES